MAMLHALRVGFLLVVIILVTKAFLPEVGAGLIEITNRVIAIMIQLLDHALETLPQT